MSSHILVSDPTNLSTRFSNKDRLGYDGDSEFGDPDFELGDLVKNSLARAEEEDLVQADRIDFQILKPYLHRIPIREADLITLYYKNEMKQEQIAKLFRITQAAVSYRLQRGKRRIQFLRTIPVLDREEFELELGPKFSDQDREILWRMYETTCQSEIAKQMKLTQGRVRHRFFRSLQRINDLIKEEAKERYAQMAHEHRRQGRLIHESDPDVQAELSECAKQSKYAKYYTVFYAISDKHFNILHEVSLPQFRNRSDAEIIPCE
jgi:DNA-directed RNA polymerase specialized sigma24 family protein